MKYFSMFTGIGGFELGTEQAYEQNNKIESKEQSKECDLSDRQTEPNTTNSNGNRWGSSATCIGYSEIDKYAIQIFEKHYPNIKNYGDATKIDTRQLPEFDLLVGGFPCQAFSIAGKRKGFDDTRGTLFFEIARILADKRPRNFVLENVKGLLSHDGGKTFQTILGVLTDLGYFVEWQVLNSKNFGVPQNRERVFFVGHLGGEPRPKVFPIGRNGEQNNEIYKRENRVAQTINATYSRNQSDGQYVAEQPQAFMVRSIDGASSTLQGEAGGTGAKTGLYAIPVLTPDREKKRQNGRRFKENGDPSFTLTGQDIHGVSDGMRIRRLTPTECERLQGFPDGWTEGISDTQRYKCLGNAVTVNVVREVIKRLF